MATKRKRGRPAITPGLKSGSVTPNRVIRVPDKDWALWRQVAATEGRSLSDWIRSIAGRAARKAVKALRRDK